jgi:hypothetical protein
MSVEVKFNSRHPSREPSECAVTIDVWARQPNPECLAQPFCAPLKKWADMAWVRFLQVGVKR